MDLFSLFLESQIISKKPKIHKYENYIVHCDICIIGTVSKTKSKTKKS